ncbi:MAG: hypothetical protein EOP92_17870 [Lysobacteraceae bacterium]|nr:MAG: hypothetical protein EOP92_17870 [Xanthomonadaceae bacterium]
MKYLVPAALSLSLVLAVPTHAAAPTARAALPSPTQAQAHIQAVQNLLGAMQVEKVLRGVAARSGYGSDAQRQAVFAKLDRTPPAEVHRRMAPALAPVISPETAAEMTRFYNTPYGKQVIHRKYNSGSQIIMAGMKPVVPPEEKKERKRAAYVNASKQLADAEPMIEREAFKLLQQISKEKR